MGNYGVLQVLGVLGNTGGLIESTVGYCRVLHGTAVYYRVLGGTGVNCGVMADT